MVKFVNEMIWCCDVSNSNIYLGWQSKHAKPGSHQKNISQSNPPGGRLNKKDGLTRYGDSHVKDKTS